ncbi:DNA-binding response regulator [bacterium]|nr:DNA-binding response regulator [Candidatus Elulimicrobium humile]
MRILVIEDEADIADTIKIYLEKQGYAVDVKYEGNAGFSALKLNQYDCCLLDLNLPGKDGMEIINDIRESGNIVPVIMLTARSQIYDKLDGFKHGADDYMTKPFHLAEVVARIEAVIRRFSDNKSHSLYLEDYEIIPTQNRVIKGDKMMDLSTKEMRLLEYLVRNQNRIIAAEELLEHVWDDSVDLFSDTVKTHIKTLRKKIDPNKKIIKTVKGKGYGIL